VDCELAAKPDGSAAARLTVALSGATSITERAEWVAARGLARRRR
jgi:hypothetical protein